MVRDADSVMKHQVSLARMLTSCSTDQEFKKAQWEPGSRGSDMRPRAAERAVPAAGWDFLERKRSPPVRCDIHWAPAKKVSFPSKYAKQQS